MASICVVEGVELRKGCRCVVAALETGTVEVMEYRPEGTHPHEDALPLVEMRVAGGLPLPSTGWSGPLVCCAGRGGDFAVASLDGRLAVARVSAEAGGGLSWGTRWARQTSDPLFGIAYLVPGLHGEEAVVACSWGGKTWFIGANDDQAPARFDAASMVVPPLRGFAAGKRPLA